MKAGIGHFYQLAPTGLACIFPGVEPKAYLDALESDGIALADAAEGNLDVPVSSCPGWNVSELVWHTGRVHHFWRAIAERRLQDPSEVKRPERPDDLALMRWYRDGVGALVETLAAAEPSQKVWTWASQKNIAFIQRRMAQETAVHRWDAQAAVGRPKAIGPELAVDGIDEYLEVMLPAAPEGLAGGRESIHLHSTDASGEWVIEVTNAELKVTRTHAKGDVAARGPASDLLLLLWRRIGPSAVEVVGDEAALERFLERADL